ncbi:MAG: DHH family phosphoesterase, partial [Oscillospiraceae bacterium]|nr:DHH family phosphoesterase [Oscillospiraceae bacterium]
MGLDSLESAASFFGQDEDGDTIPFCDPFEIRDMQKACDIISDAIDSGELICIYGDYDCDGITSTAVLSDYLENIGANVTTYINERSMGYGINPDAVRKLHEDGVGLIITVDNGISAIEEAKLCRELGITLVVTDHNQPGDVLPDAAAVVDPHRADDTSS